MECVVYVTEQTPEDTLQEDGLNVPPAFPSLQDMVPVGVELDTSEIVAVNVTGVPGYTVIEFGEIVVVVSWITFTFKDDVPELPEWKESPE